MKHFESKRFPMLITAMVLCITSAVLIYIGSVPRGDKVHNVCLLIDTSASVGGDLHNLYAPYLASLVDKSSGLPMSITRFGFKTQVLYSDLITVESARLAKDSLLGLDLYPKEAAGTNITRILTDKVHDAAGNKGSTLVVAGTDGWEDDASKINSKWASDGVKRITVVIAFPRNKASRVLSVLKNAGVSVYVATNKVELDRVVDPLLTGFLPWQGSAKNLGLISGLLAALMFSVACYFNIRTWADSRKAHEVKRPEEAPVRLAVLSIELRGSAHMAFHRTVSLGVDRISIGADLDPTVDFKLPSKALGKAAYDTKVILMPMSLDQIRVRNDGTISIIAGTSVLSQGQEATIDPREIIAISASAQISTSVDLPQQKTVESSRSLRSADTIDDLFNTDWR